MSDVQQSFHVGDAGSNPAGDASTYDVSKETVSPISDQLLLESPAQPAAARQPTLRINLIGTLARGSQTPKPELCERVRRRFKLRVQRARGDACWLWSGNPRGGYGCFYIGKVAFQAHRIAWALEHGRWPPDDLQVMHSCDETMCCNPAHLSLGTNADNQADSARKGRLNREKGEDHGRAKLSDDEIVTILQEADAGVSARSIADDHLVHIGYVRELIANKSLRVRARQLFEASMVGGNPLAPDPALSEAELDRMAIQVGWP